MAYFNNNDSYYSTSSTPEELGSYPFLQPQTFTPTGEVYDQETSTFAGDWTAADQSGFMAGPSTIPPATKNYNENFDTYFADPCLTRESPCSTPYVVGSYPAPSYGFYCPAISQPALLYHPGMLSGDSFYPSEQGWGTGMPVLPIDPVPTNFRGSQQYEIPTGVPYMDNVLNHHQPQPGATRTRVTDSRRFTPYGRYGVHPIVYEETEVGPSLYVPPPIPHDATPTMIPAGGIPKTTAHAEHKQSNTEEQESPAPQTRRARGKGFPRPYCGRSKKSTRKLREWAKVHGGLRMLPSHKDAIVAAEKVVSGIRDKVYNEDHLVKGRGRRTKAGSRDADDEYERRNGTREAYQKLSRYYYLEDGRFAWTVPRLLSKVLEDLENPEDLLEHVVVPTSTVAGWGT